MTGKPKPIASLGALLAALTEHLDGVELRLTERVVAIDKKVDDLAFQVGQTHDRTAGLEDKLTEAGKHLDEVRDAIKDQIEDLKGDIKGISEDIAGGADIRADLDELADAERRRGLNEMRDELRRRRAS